MAEQPRRHLFQAFPGLRKRVPFVSLADLPTPLEPLECLSSEVGAEIWVKRDGLTHPIYGGNKIRKFEFVFGDVQRKRARVILTGGGLGSHHTLATAVVARQVGLQAVCSYYCQPISEQVRLNLRRTPPLGIDAHFCGDYAGLGFSFAYQYLRWLLRTGRPPYFIYPGAPGTLGTLGYVNAAYEIKAQLRAIGLPRPDAIYVAVGSCGTISGLMLGARLADLGSRIIGVRIIEEDVANKPKIARLVNRTARYLRRRDPSVPKVEIGPDEVNLLDGYLGRAYAHPTEQSQWAVEFLEATEGLPLETTYTGKAMAALLEHAVHHPGSRLLFIDTFAESPALDEGDWHDLPEQFWPVFEPNHKVHCWCLRSKQKPGFCWKQQSARKLNLHPTHGPGANP
jgi:D-cysteine desulfhydrase